MSRPPPATPRVNARPRPVPSSICSLVRLSVLLAVGLLTTAGASSADVPAVFDVTTEVVNPDPGAFTATTGPLHILVDYNYEPMVWRNRRFQVNKDAVGKVFADQLDWFDSYAPGYWDGSTVRVLRAENGKISQKLLGKVKRFHHGAWKVFNPNLVPAGKSSIQFSFDDWNKRGQEWWLALTAVDKQGRDSAFSAPVRVVNPETTGNRVKPENPFTAPAPRLGDKAEGAPPPAPTDLAAKVDEATGVVSLSWKPAAGDLAGYRLHWTYIDPAKHEGTFLEMDKEGGGDRFAFKKGDMLLITRRVTTFNKDVYSPRIHGTPAANPPDFAPSITKPGKWQSEPIPFELVPHPGKLPAEIQDAGETCMKIATKEEGLVSVRKYNHADTTQNWYRVLDPAKTYVVEFIARQEGLANPNIQFHFTGPFAKDMPPVDFPLTGEWKKFRHEFKVPRMLTEKGNVGQMGLQFNGPGTVWLDNFRVYEKDTGLVRHSPLDAAVIKASGMAGLRTHDTCKTDGYTVENLLGHPEMGLSSGHGVYTRGNLSALLKEFAALGVFPWLQIEFTMDEEEWKAIVEYIAAPYDPAKDTPKSKPWAYRRVQHGQKEPYSKVFPRILFEFSNENWNPIMSFNLAGAEMPDAANDKSYNAGHIYGMLQEYTIGVMKSSPHWTPEMEKKAEFVIGGWSINDFGYQAARMSPSSKHVLVADYNGGWDAGEGPETVGNLDEALRKTLIFGAQHSRPNAIRLRELRDKFAAETGIRVELGTYEAGPGYNLDGLNGVRMTPEMVEFESRVMKSQAAGASTLDCFMNQAEQGAKLQNFFTFSRNRHYWTSHAEERMGGQAYPSWMALCMYNNYAAGDILAVLTRDVPTRNAPAVGFRAAMPDAPEVAVYATRKGDRLAVIAISRKLDGTTPTTIRLPITAAKKVTLHSLAGDPRANNLDSEKVKPASKELPPSVVARDFILDESRGAPGGLPPASVLMYVFEGATFAQEPPSAFVVPAIGQATPFRNLPIHLRVGLPKMPKSFTADNVKLGGAAEPQGATVAALPGCHGMEYDLTITGTTDEGGVEVKIADIAAADGSTIKGVDAKFDLRFPEGTLLPILAWNFGAFQTDDPKSRQWGGKPVKSTRNMPVVEPAELAASVPNLLEDNEHYNTDGAGCWVGGGQMKDSSHYYRFTLAPVKGRKLDVGQVICGFWGGSSDDSPLKPRLEVWQNGKKVGEAPFTADVKLHNKGLLHHDAGIRAVADTSKISVLRNLSAPVEIRIVFAGLEEKGGVFGVGKLGKDKDDLVVMGRLSKK